MKEFHFTKIYFNKTLYEDLKTKIRVNINERPSINLSEEEYSLRITTRCDIPPIVHRKYAIEHQLPPAKHSFPHLQFKFHTEEIGQFRIRIDIKDDTEYKKAILGFIYKIKNILEDMEKFSNGITNDILVLHLVNKLKAEGDFLACKMYEGISKYGLEFDGKRVNNGSIVKLRKNPLLLEFLGSGSIDLIEKEYTK